MPGPRVPNDEENFEIPEDGEQHGEEGSDAGQLDDEGGDEAEDRPQPEGEEAEEGPVDEKPQRQEGRADRRFQKLSNSLKQANERAARVEQELAALRAERARPQQTQETPEQERARIALMTQEERVTYLLEKSAKQNEQAIRQVQFAAADQSDRAAYQAKAAYDPRFRKFEGEVESRLADLRRQGGNANREVVLAYLIGEKVLGAQPKVDDARRQGQQRIQRQQARATSGRSDLPANRARAGAGNSLADIERRLDGVPL